MTKIVGPDGRPVRSKRPETKEIAVASVRDKFSSYPSRGLSPERMGAIFREADLGDVYRQAELFEEMEEKDTHLFSILQTRKNSVLGLDWEVMPYSDEREDIKVADLVRGAFEFEGLEDALLDLLDAIGKGFAVTEIMWRIDERKKAVVQQLKWVHQKRFRFGDLDELRLLTEEDMARGMELPENKFVVHRYKARSGHPSRAGVLRVCAWMYLFKNYSIKDWAGFAEVFGMPIRVGKYDTSTSSEDREALLQAVVQLGSDAAGIISKSTEIEFIESVKRADNIYEALAEFCNREMSKAVLGQTLTTDVGSTGSYAASKTHNEVRQDLKEADCKALAETLRKHLIKPLVMFNVPAADLDRLPWMRFKYEPPEDLETASRIYKTVVTEMGLPVAKDHVYEKFGIPKPGRDEELLLPPSPASAAPAAIKHAGGARRVALSENTPGSIHLVKDVIKSLSAEERAYLGPRFFYDDAQYRYVYEQHGQPVGFIENRQTGKKAYLNLAVRGGYRGQGISKLLINRALREIPRLFPETEKIYWITHADNKPSVVLAAKTGFKKINEDAGEVRYVLAPGEAEPLNSVPPDLFVLSGRMASVETQRQVDSLADQAVKQSVQAFKAMLAPVLESIDQAATVDELREKLVRAYADMDTADLEDLLARVMFAADLYGRVTAYEA